MAATASLNSGVSVLFRPQTTPGSSVEDRRGCGHELVGAELDLAIPSVGGSFRFHNVRFVGDGCQHFSVSATPGRLE